MSWRPTAYLRAKQDGRNYVLEQQWEFDHDLIQDTEWRTIESVTETGMPIKPARRVTTLADEARVRKVRRRRKNRFFRWLRRLVTGA